MAAKIDIINKALRILGANPITTTQLTNESNEEARIINDVYDILLDEVLATHPWNFAIKRATLTELGGTITGWTETAGQTNVWQASLTTEPAKVKFDGVEGTEVASISACDSDKDWHWESNVLYVYSTSDPDTAYTTIDAVIPEFEFDHAYQMPTDCLRLIRMEESDAEFVVEADRLLTDEDEAKIQYIAQITDTTNFSSAFIKAFSTRIAAEIAYPVTNDARLTEAMNNIIYPTQLRVAKGMDAQEGSAKKLEDLGWQEARE